MLIVDTNTEWPILRIFLLTHSCRVKPGETIAERNQRSAGVLEESVNDLLALDELAMHGNTFSIKWADMRNAISP